VEEFWRREGRRAKMETAMMAPDYTCWHGFYELKKWMESSPRFQTLDELCFLSIFEALNFSDLGLITANKVLLA
jgi:hypothetical protein